MFLLVTNKAQKTKDFAKIVSNLFLYFENLGTTIFKEHLSVAVSLTKNFHCSLTIFILTVNSNA